MRLSKFEQQTIKQSIYALDANAKVVLFGSRTNDAARGGKSWESRKLILFFRIHNYQILLQG